MQTNFQPLRPSAPFIGASWASLMIGAASYIIGLWNSPIGFNDKGFYLAAFILGLFSAISLQKTVRDRLEQIPVTSTYVGVCWAALITSLLMLGAGLFNSSFELSEKGFFGISYLLSMFAAVTVQKNIRDLGYFSKDVALEPNNE